MIFNFPLSTVSRLIAIFAGEKHREMRYLVRLSYNGSAFCGWQVQTNAPSIQECLQKALSTLLNEEISVTGAGRTDTRVNAVNYIAHFETSSFSQSETGFLCYKLNAILPAGIAVHEVSPASPNFHARFDAVQREYRYFVHRRKDPFIASRSYLYTFGLDVDAMNAASGLLLGTHDFSCFEKTGGNSRTSVCTVSKAVWESYTPDHARIMGYPCSDGDYLMFTISADRFLRNMVRATVGTMLEIGRGKRAPEWISGLLSGGTRSDAGQSVPGHALFLCGVNYPEDR